MRIKTFIAVPLIIIIALTGCQTALFGDKFRTEEEIITIFKDNNDLFVDVVNDLSEYKFQWSLRTEHVDRSDWRVTDLSSGIQIVINRKEYFSEMPSMYMKAKGNKSIKPLMKKLKFQIIKSDHYMDSDCIYFVKQTSINYASGIMYCPGGITENPYITKMVPIEDSWYYYEAK